MSPAAQARGRFSHIMRQARAIAALPGIVVGVVPAAIALLGGVNLVWGLGGAYGIAATAVGVTVAIAGITMVATTIRLFASGGGTLAPWDPPSRLVVVGPYRFVRNPMISGVFMILGGEAILLGSIGVLVWFVVFIVAKQIYILLDEEPALRARFGVAYQNYIEHVPRWVPRFTAWSPASSGAEPGFARSEVRSGGDTQGAADGT